MDKLIITKSLRSDYKNPNQIAHKVLADRIGRRDPGNKPRPGDRIAFAYIVNSKKGALQGDKIETPEFIESSNLQLNYSFYITNQLMKPLQQVFALVLEDIPAFRRKKASYLRRRRTIKQENAGDKVFLRKKLEDLANKEAKDLLFTPHLKAERDAAARSGNKSISAFFKTA